MSRPNKRKRLSPAVRAVADVLRQDWDPIGGGRMPGLPADEYDRYAPHLVSLALIGARDEVLAAHLAELERSVIGVSSWSDLGVVAATIRRTVLASQASENR
jgi:hypothetical protein